MRALAFAEALKIYRELAQRIRRELQHLERRRSLPRTHGGAACTALLVHRETRNWPAVEKISCPWRDWESVSSILSKEASCLVP